MLFWYQLDFPSGCCTTQMSGFALEHDKVESPVLKMLLYEQKLNHVSDGLVFRQGHTYMLQVLMGCKIRKTGLRVCQRLPWKARTP
jgi:hypothetical protein